ncbi:MAG: hypothetical protein BWY68_00778 [bacterium ADurb.Bin400]|nr:MAG: hypothetical protein BWY68_00778 [bacterium ADurb.Bin400]
MDDSSYARELSSKLSEETKEAIEAMEDRSKLIEELGDVLEVIEAIASRNLIDWSEIEEAQKRKREERGGFRQRIFLESVID